MDVQAHKSEFVLTSTAPVASFSTATSSKPAYYPPSEFVSGSLIARDSKRFWKAAPSMSGQQFSERQHFPPSNSGQARMWKLSIATYVTPSLWSHHVDICEQAWEQRAQARLAQMHSN